MAAHVKCSIFSKDICFQHAASGKKGWFIQHTHTCLSISISTHIYVHIEKENIHIYFVVVVVVVLVCVCVFVIQNHMNNTTKNCNPAESAGFSLSHVLKSKPGAHFGAQSLFQATLIPWA